MYMTSRDNLKSHAARQFSFAYSSLLTVLSRTRRTKQLFMFSKYRGANIPQLYNSISCEMKVLFTKTALSSNLSERKYFSIVTLLFPESELMLSSGSQGRQSAATSILQYVSDLLENKCIWEIKRPTPFCDDYKLDLFYFNFVKIGRCTILFSAVVGSDSSYCSLRLQVNCS